MKINNVFVCHILIWGLALCPAVRADWVADGAVWSQQYGSNADWTDAGGRRYTTFTTGSGQFGGNLLDSDGNPIGAIGDYLSANVGTTNNNDPGHSNPGPGWAYIPTGVAWQPDTTYRIDFVVLQRAGQPVNSAVQYGLWAGLPSDDKGAGDYNNLFDSSEKPGQAATRESLGTEGLIKISSGVLANGDGIFVSALDGASLVDVTFEYTTGSDVSELDEMVLFLRTDTGRIHWDSISVSAISTFVDITGQPQPQTVKVGEKGVFEVEAAGLAGYSIDGYQWYYSQTPAVTPETDIEVGENLSSLTLEPVTIEDEGYYYCKIIASNGTTEVIYSHVAGLTVGRKIGHWTLDLDDLVDGVYLDSAGTANAVPDAVPPETVFVDGIVGDGLDLAAEPTAAAIVEMPSPTMVSEEMTVSLWVMWAGPTATSQGLVSKRQVGTGAEWFWNISDHGDVLRLGTLTGPRVETPPPAPGRWVHQAFTVSDQGAKVYRDGILEAANAAFVLGSAEQSQLVIGANYVYDGTTQKPFNGIIDDVKLFNYALSSFEIAQVYDAASGQNPCLSPPPFDIDGDCVVHVNDLVLFAEAWLQTGHSGNVKGIQE